MKKAQYAAVRAVIHRDAQLAPPRQACFTVRDLAFELHDLTIARFSQPHDARLILITQRQVQRQVNVTAQAEFFERLLCR